jgi:hypothetical protein
MKIPDEFIHIANSFHQDTLTIHETLDDAINESVLGLTETEIRTAKDYLDLLLSGNYSSVELAKIWNSTPAFSGGFGMAEEPDNGAEWFLGKIRDALSGSKPLSNSSNQEPE